MKTKRILTLFPLRWLSARGGLFGLLTETDKHADWDLKLLDPESDFRVWRFKKALKESVDGVIVTVPPPDEALEALCQSRVPTVFVNIPGVRLPQWREDVGFVYSDSDGIGRMGAEHLLSRGEFASFGFVHRPEWPLWSNEVERAFRKAVAASGAPCATFREGTLDDWLRALPKPAGVMASIDRTASQVMERCRRLGISVPGQVAVIGVGNESDVIGNAEGITTVVADLSGMVGRAVKELARLMSGSRDEYPEIVVPPKGVVARRSTAVNVTAKRRVAFLLGEIARRFAEKDLSVASLVRPCGCSRWLAEMEFAKATGTTLRRAIEAARLEKAAQLLKTTSLAVGEVALRSGFRSGNRFTTLFRLRNGLPPREWRRREAALRRPASH